MNKRVRAILSDVFRLRDAEIHPGLTKDDVGNWDSLTQMDLVVSLERAFAIELGINDIARMQSVADVLAVLADKGVDLAD